MNLKLFGQRNGGRYVEHNLDGLMRGDFITRMNGLGQAVQNALLTPDEARALENRQAKGGNAEKLFMQGATVPIDQPIVEPVSEEEDPLRAAIEAQGEAIRKLTEEVSKRSKTKRVPVRDPESGLITAIEEVEYE